MLISERILRTFPGIKPKIAYFAFIISLLLELIAVNGDNFYHGMISITGQLGDYYHFGLWRFCNSWDKNPTDPYPEIHDRCTQINLLDTNGNIYFESTESNGAIPQNVTIEFPFPGPAFQVCRIWYINSIVFRIFGGSIPWILFLKENVRWIYSLYIWFISLVLSLLFQLTMVSSFGK